MRYTGPRLRVMRALGTELPGLSRKSIEKQDALDQLVGVFHLVDRLVVFMFTEYFQTPVPEHARMKELLVDYRQFVDQDLVQMADDFFIALHDGTSHAK